MLILVTTCKKSFVNWLSKDTMTSKLSYLSFAPGSSVVVWISVELFVVLMNIISHKL